jgi:hypothetical protein
MVLNHHDRIERNPHVAEGEAVVNGKRARLLPTLALGLALLVSACSGDESRSQTSPTPVLPAQIRPAATAPVWAGCPLPEGVAAGTCQISLSIQNSGTGCASGTVIKVRFLDAGDVQVGGPDTQMDTTGGGLSSMTIRPNEVVSLTSVTGVDAAVYSLQKKVVVIPFWHNVACS